MARFCIYTRTGDDGSSSLYSGERRSKQDPVFQALGDLDELNSTIGIAAEHCEAAGNALVPALRDIQCCLFDAGALVATPRSTAAETKIAQTVFDEQGEKVKALEQMIDAMDANLPPLSNFILPGGGHSSTALHQARAVCRRAERAVCVLDDVEAVQVYLNRLSDFLFVAARAAAQHENQAEVAYQSHAGEWCIHSQPHTALRTLAVQRKESRQILLHSRPCLL
eukprot:m.40262 g.40262  ORF g.40262 m.40262 type:complete len:224 (-) comp10296_c0_seq1:80-751(-)